jgi:hypothetical protein
MEMETFAGLANCLTIFSLVHVFLELFIRGDIDMEQDLAEVCL